MERCREDFHQKGNQQDVFSWCTFKGHWNFNVSVWNKTKNSLCTLNATNTIGADNWISWLSSFKIILMIVYIEFPANYVCFPLSLLCKASYIALGLIRFRTLHRLLGRCNKEGEEIDVKTCFG